MEKRTTISRPTEGAAGKTGTWRDQRPVLDKQKCKKCLRCWIFCPEGTIIRRDDNSVSIDYVYCKGCGVCAKECLFKAIVMVREGEQTSQNGECKQEGV
ncbi:MAG: ferredoxin [Thermoplasmata archaeon HGW-Thermoplasmata-2]|nr:MAG: ferredoxin [Thermoplasmata archaeon HGW-Thermoplasmata-2]